MEKMHFKTIADHHSFLGLPPPEHPLLSVLRTESPASSEASGCLDLDVAISTDFYTISLKKIISGELFYGRTQYDCENGTMIFLAPGQEIRTRGVKIESVGRSISVHEDFLRGHSVQALFQKSAFFNYAVHEALHLSPREERQMAAIFDNIETEYSNNPDEFSREIILSQIDTLLRYADRFYRRQFHQRKESGGAVQQKFDEVYERLIAESIPSVQTMADELHVTPRYLSDALKAETGKTAKENLHFKLIDEAKNRLLESDDSVATIAYALGFEYPQYFSRLFKRKTGMTPTEYRTQLH